MEEPTSVYTLELTRNEALILAGSAYQEGRKEADFRYWTVDPALREARRARWESLSKTFGQAPA